MLILTRHVSWDMRSSCFYQVISETMIAISETMTAQIVLEVQIALMTDLSADRSISLVKSDACHTVMCSYVRRVWAADTLYKQCLTDYVC